MDLKEKIFVSFTGALFLALKFQTVIFHRYFQRLGFFRIESLILFSSLFCYRFSQWIISRHGSWRKRTFIYSFVCASLLLCSRALDNLYSAKSLLNSLTWIITQHLVSNFLHFCRRIMALQTSKRIGNSTVIIFNPL